MKQRRPIGITIFVLIGFLYAVVLLFLGIVFIIGKSLFVVMHEVSPCRVYIHSFILFVLGSCFLIFSIALLKKRLWARRFFFLTVLLYTTLEGWLFVKEMAINMRLGISPTDLRSVFEFSFALILSLFTFWYFKRETVRTYLNS